MSEKLEVIVSDVNFLALRDEHDAYLRNKRQASPEGIKNTWIYLDRFFKWLSQNYGRSVFGDFDFEKLREFLDSYTGSHPPGSCRDMCYSLRSFLRFCYLEGYLRFDLTPLLAMRRPRYTKRVPRVLQDSDLLKLINGIKRDSKVGKRDYAIISLLVSYGVRGCQIRALRLSDLDWESEKIHFPAAKNGDRIIQPLLPEVGNAIADYLTRGRPSCDRDHVFLCLKPPPAPLSSSNALSSIVKRRLREAGVNVPKDSLVGSHIFRHTFASRLLRAEEPLKNISDMLGHRYYDSTMVYARIDMVGLANATLEWEDSYYENV